MNRADRYQAEGKLWREDKGAWVALAAIRHHPEREVREYHWNRLTQEQKEAVKRAGR